MNPLGNDRPKVFIVDDDEAVLESLAGLLQASGFRTDCFASAQAFLAHGNVPANGCVIADVRMPDMDGIELLGEMKKRDIGLPVIIITGHGDIPLAVRAMKAGAFEFLEKPCERSILLESVRRALRTGEARPSQALPGAIREKLATLTDREREVLDLVLHGKLNKSIAYELSISHRTVEIHRSRLMQKLGARNLPELVRMFLPFDLQVGPKE